MRRWRHHIRWTVLTALQIVGLARALCQSPVEIDALHAKAWDLVLSRPMEAREYAIQALEWSKKITYLPGMGDGYSALGYLYCNEGAYEDGYQYYSESLRVRRLSGDSAKVANVFINLSIFKNDEGRYDEARADAAKAIAILEGLLHHTTVGTASNRKIAFSLGKALLNLSNIYSDFQDNVLALEYARKGYRILSTVEDGIHLALAMKTLANRFYTAWEPQMAHDAYADSAQLYYHRALEKFQHPRDEDADLAGKEEVADIYYNLAQIDLDRSNFQNAWDLLSRSEKVFQEVDPGADRSEGLFYVWSAKGKWMLAFKKDYPAALAFFRKASQLPDQDAIDAGARLELYKQLSESFVKCNLPDSAFFYQKLALSLSQSSFTERQTSFQKGERSDWQQKLNTEIAQSALVKERQRYLTVALIALVLLVALMAVIAWVVVQNLRRKAAAADRQIQEMVGNLDAKYLEGIESEREEIAGVLHDDLGGQSVANTWMLEALAEQLAIGSGEKQLALKILQSSRQLSESIRAFSHRMSSLYVQRSGLVPALQELCQNISHSGRIQAKLFVEPWETQLDVGQEIQLMRILQELITNTVKYARAKEISLVLKTIKTSDFYLRYADNGVGFDIQSTLKDGKGLGMEHIARRVKVLGGNLEVGSDTGTGMWVVIRFPLASETSPAPGA